MKELRSPCLKCKDRLRDKLVEPCFGCLKLAEYQAKTMTFRRRIKDMWPEVRPGRAVKGT